MKFQIDTPLEGTVPTGNRCTAWQWADILRGLGHREVSEHPDVLIALHAAKSHEAVRRAEDKVVVALTGTDLYPELGERALASLRIADRIVALQPRARERVPADLRDKVRVIVQSATRLTAPEPRSTDPFEICVVGHLREVKDPLRAAEAARRLPDSSRIRILHQGAILEPEFEQRVAREQRDNPRYRWLGSTDSAGAQQLMARCQLQVISSRHEGGARVIGESLVVDTPLLAARNDAADCLLGTDYPGLYDFGDTEALAGLMQRAESDPGFLSDLRERSAKLKAQFDPKLEIEAWRELMTELEG